jgi:hypothetical protein
MMKRLTLKLLTLSLLTSASGAYAVEQDMPMLDTFDENHTKQVLQEAAYHSVNTDLMDTLNTNVATHLESRLVSIEESLLETLANTFTL